MKNFSDWLSTKLVFNEFITSFGKYKGQDHTNIPSDWLDWVIKKGIGAPNLTPSNIEDIRKELVKRDYGYYARPAPSKGGNQPAPSNQQSAAPQPEVKSNQPWILAIAKGNMGFKPGQKMAMQKSSDGWNYLTLDEPKKTGTLPATNIADIVQSIKYEDGNNKGKFISSDNPKLLKSLFNQDRNIPPANPYRIKSNKITEEQKAIEQAFVYGDPNNPKQQENEKQNIVISALAGTGKTSVLKHLASLYKPGQKWLYLVFNKKNQTEAEEHKFHEELGKLIKAFPEEIEVLTSHSFLGKVLKENHIYGKIHPTDLPKTEKGKKYSKLTDVMSRDWFIDKATDELGIPTWLLKSYTSATKNLISKAKNYAIHPDNPNLTQELDKLIDSYDIDTKLIPPDKQTGKERDYKPEIIQGALEVMNQTLPGKADPAWMTNEGEPLRGIRDQDDTLWYAAIHADQLIWPHYDVIMADEIQDFNKAQIIMLKKLNEAGARIVAVGDKNQCHPAGTLISLTGGESKPIEGIKVGDQVVTYNTKKNRFPGLDYQGRKVLEVACRDYTGPLINIQTYNTKLLCTPNHRCLVRFINNDFHCLYLMVKGTSARVGICPLAYKDGLGVSRRANQEKADKVWILDMFPSRQLAQIAELKVSQKFNLPQLVFMAGNLMKLTQEIISEVYNDFGNLLNNAKKCLSYYEREWEFPVWARGKKERYGGLKQNYMSYTKTFLTQACNLISGYMEMCVSNNSEENNGEWTTINVSKTYIENQKVYSLSVEPTELGRKLYVANNIVVGNSIYRFRGADSESFDNVAKMLSTTAQGVVTPTLSTNFRSSKHIINYVNQHTHVNTLKEGRPDIDKEVKEDLEKEGKTVEDSVTEDKTYPEVMDELIGEWHQSGQFKRPTALIARTNKPLIHAAMQFMKNKVPFEIVGNDFQDDLMKFVDEIVKKFGPKTPYVKGKFKPKSKLSIQDFRQYMNNWVKSSEDSWNALSDKDKAKQHQKEVALQELRDTSEAINSVIQPLADNDWKTENGTLIPDTEEFKHYLDFIFKGVHEDNAKKLQERDPKSFITITTAHKSKGLEWQRVFIVRDDLFPHPAAKNPADIAQEHNARYVAYTRATHELHVLQDGEPGGKKKKKY